MYRTTNKVNNVFYMPYNGVYEWMHKDIFSHLNFITMTQFCINRWDSNDWPDHIKFDDVLNDYTFGVTFLNNRNIQTSESEKFSNHFHIPTIIVDHELPTNTASYNLREFTNLVLSKHTLVFPHPIIKKEWAEYSCVGKSEYIPYGITPKELVDKKEDVFVAGDYDPADYRLLNSMLELSGKNSMGYNNGMTQEYREFQQIEHKMATAKIFLAGYKPLSPPLLSMIAASYGCLPVLNRTVWSESVFEDGKTALLFDDIISMKRKVKSVLNNPIKLESMSQDARDSIICKFNFEVCKKAWGELIKSKLREAFIR